MSSPELPRKVGSSPESTNKEKPTSAPKYHKHYCDPSGNTVLRSKDGVLFRASSFRLSKASTMFAGMFATAGPTHGHSPETIDIPYDSGALVAFLDLIHQTTGFIWWDPSIFLHEGFYRVAELHAMVHFYDVKDWMDILDQAIDEGYRNKPDRAFGYAACTNNVEMARRALQEFSKHQPEGRRTHLFWELMDDIPDSWQLHLFRLLATDHKCRRPDKVDKEENLIVLEPDWSKIADLFDPNPTDSPHAETA